MTLWSDTWAEFVAFLAWDVEIRKVICSTKAVESVGTRMRKAVRVRGRFPNETAVLTASTMCRSSDGIGRVRELASNRACG
jgi:transposase-like protein